MTEKATLRAEGFLWRRYETGVPVKVWYGGTIRPTENAMLLWRSEDDGAFPDLNRWERLGDAFIGFVSMGTRRPMAVCYDMRKVARSLMDGGYFRLSWCRGGDAAEAGEVLLHNLLGVWMGDRTPFMFTKSADFFAELQEAWAL